MATDSMTIPTLAGGITVYWVKETLNTSDMAAQSKGLKPESNPTSGHVHLTKYCIAGRVLIPRKLIRTSLPSVEDAIRMDLPRALDSAMQKAILMGAANADTDPVAGLDGLIVTNAKAWNAGNPRRGLIDFLYATGESYGENGAANLVVAGTAALRVLASLEDKNGQPLNLLSMPNGIIGTKSLLGVETIEAYCTPSTYGGGTDSRMYCGNFGLNANVALDNAMFVQVNPYTYAANNLVEVLYETYFAFAPSHEAMFGYISVPTA
jgi:HK97 family phage major capsid protein